MQLGPGLLGILGLSGVIQLGLRARAVRHEIRGVREVEVLGPCTLLLLKRLDTAAIAFVNVMRT